MEQVAKFLKEADTYYLATVEGDQPRVRPFGTAHIFEGKLYIQTGKSKAVSKQIHANPKVEICAFKGGEWLRVAGELVEDDRREARQSMLDEYPSLQKMFNDARASGLALFVREGYRTFQDQQQIMNERIREYENQGNSKRRATIKNQNLCLEEYLKKYK